MSTTDLLRLSLNPLSSTKLTSLTHSNVNRILLPLRRRLHRVYSPGVRTVNRVFSKAIEFKAPELLQQVKPAEEELISTVLLDVSGMMCGACVTRVKSIIASDERVDSVVVNMLTETAAIKLKDGGEQSYPDVAEELAKKVTASGFDARKRPSGIGVEAKVKKWRETVEKKEALLLKSRNRVAFAWTLVALCCGSHASHILHSLGIHLDHGEDLNFSFS